MAVVGIDFGEKNCYISVARAGGIETIANDYSLRDTPSVVGFSGRQRLMGVNANNQMLTNLKRTFFGFKHMLGRSFKDPMVQDIIAKVPYDVEEGPDGKIRICADFLDKRLSMTPEEVAAMLFTKLKATAENALGTKVKDVVISCPCYFTDRERRALLDAAAIAGLNVLRLLNDTTATALAYGIYKQDLPAPEEKARNVVFVDVGHSGTQVAACSFNKGKLVVKACTSDRGVGGEAFDQHLAKYFASDFKSKTGLDPLNNARAYLKLLSEIEKVKKQMSANTNKLPLNIECFMEERDLAGRVDRAAFEEMMQEELGRFERLLEGCLAEAEWKPDDVYSVEVVGGSTRIPIIKSVIEKVVGKVPNTTLNADEAVSRGCALQCAILSPTFKVREFSVTDIQPYPVKLLWRVDGDNGEMVVFPKNHQFPFSKLLTFFRKDNFVLEALYDGGDPAKVPLPDMAIGHFEVGEVRPSATDGSSQKVKVKARININGIFAVTSASLVEKREVEEDVPMEIPEETPAAQDAAQEQQQQQPKDGEDAKEDKNGAEAGKEAKAGEEAVPEEGSKKVKMVKQVKTVSRNVDLPVTPKAVGSFLRDRLEAMAAQEAAFNAQDVQEAERLVAKNSVEEYIYDIRSKIHDELEEYLSEGVKAEFSSQLEATENWLYEEGEDCERSVYVEKLKELKLVGEAAKRRKSEYEGRKAAVDALGHSLQMAAKVIEAFKAGDQRYDHLDAEQVAKVEKAIEEKKAWLDSNYAALQKVDKVTNPSVLICQFYQERDSFESMSKPILNKAKPKVEEPPPPPPPTTDKKEPTETSGGDASSPKKGSGKGQHDDEDMTRSASTSSPLNAGAGAEHHMEVD